MWGRTAFVLLICFIFLVFSFLVFSTVLLVGMLTLTCGCIAIWEGFSLERKTLHSLNICYVV